MPDRPGVILAGGRSSRMGQDKALVHLGGRPMIAAVIARLAPQAAPLAISANGDPARLAAFGLPVLPDEAPGHPGPLAGVLAAMDWAAGLGAEAVVTVPVDVPMIPPDLVGRLAAAGPFALARTPGGWQGACALWPVGLRMRLRADLGAGMRRLTDWALAQGAVAVDFDDEAAFANVNTPADLARAEAAIMR
ncbi:MAG: molybdenum cofactor guanylyltransferase MobA [Gemmobacter sp.]